MAVATRSRSLGASRYAAMLAVTFVLGVAAVELATLGESTSAWWPAAGAATIAILMMPRRWRIVAAVGVAVVASLSNMVAGRAVDLSIAFGIANAIETYLVVLVLTRQARTPRLTSVREVSSLVIAASAGALVGAILAGLSVAILSVDDFGSTALSVFTSHVSAILAIVPMALAWGPEARSRGPAYRWVQPVVLAAVVAFVFSPANQLPLEFVLFPVLMWAAFTLSTRALAIELVLVVAATTTLTIFGGGPFADPSWQELNRRFVVQAFLLTLVGSSLYVSAARLEQMVSAARAERREQLLRTGIVGAPIGMLMLREDRAGNVSVIQSNTRAVLELGEHVASAPNPASTTAVPLLPVDDATRSVLDAVEESIGSPTHDPTSVEVTVRDRTLRLTVTRTSSDDDETLVTVQVQDVTERLHSERALQRALQDEREAAERLRAVDRERDDFVASVSHELRTPITSILGFVEILLDEAELEPAERSQLEIVERNARRLGGLVEDILAITTTSRSQPGPCDVTTVAEEAVQDVHTGALHRGVRLRMHDTVPAYVVCVRADLERILINLLSNAVKFSPQGASVEVEVELTDSVVRIAITDQGPGIPPDQLDGVFERFHRGTFATENQVPGVGLGLAMVRELAGRHHFAVRLESDGVSGTTAILEMPRVAEPQRSPATP
ncbi:sensor histidine kinase [Demequina aestuarii]|uniref:sensor histidine kinase n=1 Tax=Demequina aestuarii TaxID=327095 RepID=UPI000ABA205F|nr:ATP-binding protein [Demequina aestuarii]